jgi:hypothetical protein
MAFLDYKPSVIESKIIRHIERLKERKISYSAIHVSYAAIVHFFEINDINLNTRKISDSFLRMSLIDIQRIGLTPWMKFNRS